MKAELHTIVTADGTIYEMNRDILRGKGRLVLNPSPGNWGAPPVQYQRTRYYRQDGESELDFRLGIRNFTLLMTDSACDRDDWLTIRENLLNATRPNRGGFLTYTFVTPDGLQRSIQGRALAPFEAVDEDVFDDYAFNESIQFECPDPVWFKTTSDTCTGTRRTAEELVFPITFPIVFGSAERWGDCIIPYGASGGTWYAYPIITATGPFDRLTINHEEKAISLYFIKQVFAGQTITFDLRRRYNDRFELIGPTVVDAAGADQFGYLDKLSNLVDFRLEPASLIVPGGVNTISFDAPGLVDGQTDFSVQYTIRYYGI